MTTKQIDKIQKRYLALTQEFNKKEIRSAPSGEWAEYNIDYIRAEEYLNGFVEAMQLLGMDISLLEIPDGAYE